MSAVRLFVALDLPDAARAEIDDWGRGELRDPALKRVVAENLHITLAFLGNVDTDEVGALSRVVEDAAAGQSAPAITLGDPVPRPARGRPRLFALPADSPGTVGIQSRLVEGLAAAGLHTPEVRPYWPHVTLARVRSESGSRRRPASVGRPPGGLPEGLRRAFDGVRVTLYRSVLQSKGAQYTPLAQVELSQCGRQ